MRYLLVLVLLFVLVGCSGSFNYAKIIPVVNEDFNDISVYFCPREDCDGELSKFILSSKESVHCAFFDLDLENVISALKKRNSKLVVDTDNYKWVQDLDFVKQDKRSSFMHNKFCIVDNEWISSGSMNPTITGNGKNNNNLIIIRSKTLAKNYEAEFQELWNNTFGKGEKVKNPIVYLNNSRVENYFCPEDDCGEKVKDVLAKAEKEIRFMTFSFTHNGIANRLLLKNLEGVDIKGIFENRGSGSEYSKYSVLKYQGIDVRKDTNPGVLHHKVYIVDKNIVITGSFNPSKNADTRNDENILIIYDEETAKRYLEEFDYIWRLYSE